MVFERNNYFIIWWIPLLCLCLILLLSCTSGTSPSYRLPEKIVLEEFSTIVSLQDTVLSTPNILRYSYKMGSLFIYDAGRGEILALNKNGERKTVYSRTGRGPGEFIRVNNLFAIDDYLYAVDPFQFAIQKYNRNGKWVSTSMYRLKNVRPNTPMAPFSSSTVVESNLENQPFITLSGNILVSALPFSNSMPMPVQSVYELRDWQMNRISKIGKIQAGTRFTMSDNDIQSAIDNREVPGIYKSNAFPVHDRAHHDEIFLIFNALPKIVKYDTAGTKLWESDLSGNGTGTRSVKGIPEMKHLRNRYFEEMDNLLKSQSAHGINSSAPRYYSSGVSSPDGELYLILNGNPPVIHRFNNKGKLVAKYQLEPGDIELRPIFDIDFTNRHLYIVTEEGEIRSYPLPNSSF